MTGLVVKIHKSNDGRTIIAICDKDILGKNFEEGKAQLDLTKGFYKGTEMSEDEVIDLVRGKSCYLNIVGKKSIELAIRKDLIKMDNIRKIAGIPYTQVILS